jgi:8-oxo-dGTP pyrophosphatase MutT (NUDIX family)
MPLAQWTVAGALVESGAGVLLVQNRRRSGAMEWSTPGGVIDSTDATVLAGLAREVEEETGLVITSWEGPVYEVRATAHGLGWLLRCEVYRALAYEGTLRVDDPDGIVVDAAFTGPGEWADLLGPCALWVREPLLAWLEERWGPHERRPARRADVAGVIPGVITSA